MEGREAREVSPAADVAWHLARVSQEALQGHRVGGGTGCGKEGPHLAMTRASRGFSQGAVPGWGFSRDRTGSSGRLLWCHGSQVSMDMARGSASLLSSHGRGIEPD